MNQQISPGVVAAVLAVVILVLGVFAWRVFRGPSGGTGENPQQQIEQDMRQMMPGGPQPGAPVGR